MKKLVTRPSARSERSERRRKQGGAIVGASITFAALGFAAQSCGTDASSTFVETGPCATTYSGLCGKACTTDEGCPNGLYCDTGTCTAQCIASGSGCAFSQGCDSRGRCVGNTIGQSDSGGGGLGDACIDLTVTLGKVVPTVVLLVDQSSTMAADFGGAQRWDVVSDALMGADGGIVKRLEGEVIFGLSHYTRAGGFPQDASTCPQLLSVAPASGDYAAMLKLYADSAGPTGGTPTGESIDKLIGRVNGVIVDGGGFATLATAGPKIIVLATDGEPDVCANGDDEDAGRRVALAATEAAFGAGIRVFVIGVGNQIGAVRLKELANAGAGQPIDTGDAAPFSTSNRQDFVNAMTTIANGVRTCIFKLGGQVAPGEDSKGTVTLDGAPLSFNDPNGWRLNNSAELELLGTACDAIKTTASSKLVVRFPCGTFQVR